MTFKEIYSSRGLILLTELSGKLSSAIWRFLPFTQEAVEENFVGRGAKNY